MKHVLVSACLRGMPCRYDGRSKPAALTELSRAAALVPFCPEIYGGLPTPRPSAERDGERVKTKDGTDVTEAFHRGAALAVELAKALDCRYALLKDKSPSCGRGRIYDGTFTGTLTDGSGVAAEALERAGVRVFLPQELDALLAALRQDE